MRIIANNADQALREGIRYIFNNAEKEQSRNGPVLTVPDPVIIAYRNPQNRVLFNEERDANPFFHLFEALWMLGGRNDVAFVSRYNTNISTFSDDGDVFHGAYGFRWRNHWSEDQIVLIVDMLKRDPETRRAVLTMWSPDMDLYPGHGAGAIAWGKDVPCNTQAYFRIVNGKLNMTVTNRSNDAIWGAFGANLVHMSLLLEYVALLIDRPMGTYFQFTNNLHIYTDRFNMGRLEAMMWSDPPLLAEYITHPLFKHGASRDFHADLEQFLNGGAYYAQSSFFDKIVHPMASAWGAYKEGEFGAAQQALGSEPYDWLIAARQWLQRRANAAASRGAATTPPGAALTPASGAQGGGNGR